MPKVFISHSWEDNKIAQMIAERLKNDGVDIWVDYEGISGGDSLPDKICYALEWCDILLLLWSKASVESYYVGLEWKSALDLQKKIIPCNLDGSGMPAILRSFSYINFQNIEMVHSELRKALNFKIISHFDKMKSSEWHSFKLSKSSFTYSLRSNPKSLSTGSVQMMLKKYDFFCNRQKWNKAYSNPKGKGLKNDFEFQIDKQVVVDCITGLIWQQSGSYEKLNFEKSKEYIKLLNREKYAGFNNWQLPTLEQAMSLLESQKINRELYIDPKFDPKQTLIWTADNYKYQSCIWIVNFGYGICDDFYVDQYCFVRAVCSIGIS